MTVSAAAARTRELIESYQGTGDSAARDQILSDYVPLVRSLCRRFLAAREPQEDLQQVGMIGLLNAVEKFDLDRGTSFSSLAIPEVLGAILNHLRDHSTLMKIPRTLRRNKLALDKASETLASSLGRWPTAVELSQACDLSEKEVRQATELAWMSEPQSLDAIPLDDDSDARASLIECLGTEDKGFDLSLDRLVLATALDTLPSREKTILRLRFYKELSQRQIAERIHVSQMHVSRLERSALRKLRDVLQRGSEVLGVRSEGSNPKLQVVS